MGDVFAVEEPRVVSIQRILRKTSRLIFDSGV